MCLCLGDEAFMLFLPFLLTTATLGPVAVISLGKEPLGPAPQPQRVAFCVCAPAVASHLPTPGPPQRPPPSPPACACSFSREHRRRVEKTRKRAGLPGVRDGIAVPAASRMLNGSGGSLWALPRVLVCSFFCACHF